MSGNTSYTTGTGTVTGTNLNLFAQTVENVIQLRGFTGTAGMAVVLQGTTSPGDGGGGILYWNPTSTATDNGTTVIAPSGAAIGRWITIGASVSGGTVTTVATAGAGISGGPITTAGTLAVEWNAGTVDAIGSGLTISSTTLSATGGGSSEWTAGTVTTIGAALAINSDTLAVSTTGVSAATYGSATSIPQITVNAQGQITAASNVTVTALPPTTFLAVGSYITAQYRVTATPVPGNTYAGSTLFNPATNTTYSASGTWRSMGPANGFTSACCNPTYSIGLFVRIS